MRLYCQKIETLEIQILGYVKEQIVTQEIALNGEDREIKIANESYKKQENMVGY